MVWLNLNCGNRSRKKTGLEFLNISRMIHTFLEFQFVTQTQIRL